MQSQIEQNITQLRQLYIEFGTEAYAERCTQLQHAEQCGTFALEQGEDEEMALAAFLHDVGHFVAEQEQQDGFDRYGHFKHSQIGAEYLKTLGFSERIVRLVRFHVQAKRYLAAAEPGYLEALSAASLHTLEQQGGPMSKAEQTAFEQHEDLTDLLKLRALDDMGKLTDKSVYPLPYWLEKAAEHLGRVDIC